jgi:UV DNA damage endonuclease
MISDQYLNATFSGRLGFACVIADSHLRASDGRRPQNNPHLKHSLTGLLQVFDLLAELDIEMFRLPSNLIPYGTHPEYPQLAWRRQINESETEIAAIRERLLEQPIRLSFHPSQFILLNSNRTEVTKKSVEDLRWQARLLDLFGCSYEARVLTHVGGAYGDRTAAEQRLLRNIDRLPDYVRRRFSLENDDRIWTAAETLALCQQADVPMIFDFHHHRCLNNNQHWLPLLRDALSTWPNEVRPKIHFSSPKTTPAAGQQLNLRAHADFIDPFVFQDFVDCCKQANLPVFDVMIEAKAKQLALLELRKQISF